ncbi:hypothetical protein BJ742DRAFT_780236 [Cladochytrium replicatum]|nr:hypothetical protein BJ742DRAFT_780236 [Cladochytrium replicatum]
MASFGISKAVRLILVVIAASLVVSANPVPYHGGNPDDPINCYKQPWYCE